MSGDCLELAELVLKLAQRLRDWAEAQEDLLARLEEELESVCAERRPKEEIPTLFSRLKDLAGEIARIRDEVKELRSIEGLLRSQAPHVFRSCGGLLKLRRELRGAADRGADVREVKRVATKLLGEIGVPLVGGRVGALEASAYDVFEEICVRRLQRRLF